MMSISVINDVILLTLILCTGVLYLKWKTLRDKEAFEKFLAFLVILILYPYIIYKFDIGHYSNTYELGRIIDTLFNQLVEKLMDSSQNLDKTVYGSIYNNIFLDTLSKIGLFAYFTLMFMLTLATGSVLKFFKEINNALRRK